MDKHASIKLLVLLLLCLHLRPVESGSGSGKNKRDSLGCLEFFKLILNLKSKHTFAKINEYLHEEAAFGQPTPEDDIKLLTAHYLGGRKKPFNSKEDFEALSLFGELEIQRSHASIDEFCSQQSVQNLQLIDIELGAAKDHSDSGETSCDRVANVHRLLVSEHWNKCVPIHAAKFDQVLGKVDEATLIMINESVSGMISQLTVQMYPNQIASSLNEHQMLEVIKRLKSLDAHETERLATISFKMGHFSRIPGRLAMSERKMLEFLNEYLFKPCVYYTARLDEALESATVDLENLCKYGNMDAERERTFFSNTRDKQRFFSHWANWCACENVLNLDNFNALASNLRWLPARE